MAVRAGGTVARLRHDAAADRWVIALDPPGPAGGLPLAVRDHLRANDFAPDEAAGGWVRAVDHPDARYQDLLDCERALLKAADLIEAAVPGKRAGRGRR